MKKVSELEGAELDYWVAKALGLNTNGWVIFVHDGKCKTTRKIGNAPCEIEERELRFCEDWSHGGPIIEREHIWLAESYGSVTWRATMALHFWDKAMDGPTPLIAAMRCFVASKFGESVD